MRKQLVTKVFSTVMAVMLMIGMVLPTMTYAQAKDLNKHSDAQSHMLDAVQKQEAFQKQKPYLHTELQGLKGDKQIEVIVHLSENPVALEKAKKLTNQLQFTRADEQRALKKVSKQQVTFLQKLKTSNIQANKGYSFTHVLNGVALSLQEKDVETLLNLPGVIHVEPDAEMIASEVTNASHQPKASMKTSISHLGIEELWEQGLEGQGVKVGVIDSGIDYQHPEFADVYKGGRIMSCMMVII
ncbi:protease inhibitor I9 family protein [Ornithinibacillus gellani]|uniref:protease inhibitor I9 family protein n=1 Tax=Ornithinibacillus gellani TaxID=2293253 RepID=UPI001680D563|nr:protease inhibitor I9 family protein [Ornithinibacillus gellani]